MSDYLTSSADDLFVFVVLDQKILRGGWKRGRKKNLKTAYSAKPEHKTVAG